VIKWFPQRIIEYFNKKGIDKVTVDILKIFGMVRRNFIVMNISMILKIKK